MSKNLIFDCDGVLYPLTELSVREIVEAMKSVYRTELHLNGEQQTEISHKTQQEGHLGMFNYIREMCKTADYNFDKFCRKMSDRINYNNIKPNYGLWNTLQILKQDNNLVIWSNNSRVHLDKVFQRVFNKDIMQITEQGIQVVDIKSTRYKGYFYPKQSTEGLALFLRRTGFKPEDCVLFDDTPANISVAEKYGLKGVLVDGYETLRTNLKTYMPQVKKQGKIYE
ncbi:MAG: HAD hydrolase-like protein [Alphaproteobacteria bacterium]|nr:HAD hydrolase-like protein [Alphaproteobacteria bacterium]